jgi:hypothetical protein
MSRSLRIRATSMQWISTRKSRVTIRRAPGDSGGVRSHRRSLSAVKRLTLNPGNGNQAPERSSLVLSIRRGEQKPEHRLSAPFSRLSLSADSSPRPRG